MTTGRTPAEAVVNYRHAVRRLLSCVTDSVVDVAGGYHPSPTPHTLTLNNGQPAPLGGLSRLMLRLQENYRIVESGPPGRSWHVELDGYNYVVYDQERQEVLIYHWHPRGNSPIVTPHLHLKQGARVGRPDVRDSHLPTGRISLGSLLRYLIRDLYVRTRRPDWEFILEEDPE